MICTVMQRSLVLSHPTTYTYIGTYFRVHTYSKGRIPGSGVLHVKTPVLTNEQVESGITLKVIFEAIDRCVYKIQRTERSL